MNVNERPFVGALVRYVLPNSPEHVAAIVCHVHPCRSAVNLTVFMPNGVPGPVMGVYEDQETNARGTWHWRTE
jgi:hypothetical protein